MKTIKEAYEELKGDLKNTDRSRPETDKYLFKKVGETGYICSCILDPDFDCKAKYICTVEEFNNYKGDDVKEYKGKLYQIGSAYEFSSEESFEHFIVSQLTDIDSSADVCAFKYKQRDHIHGLNFCREIQCAGTVTEAPIQLEDGKAYQFNARGKTFNGIYEKFHNWLNVMDGQHFDITACTNIKPLTVEGE